jgi:hypothetical protein
LKGENIDLDLRGLMFARKLMEHTEIACYEIIVDCLGWIWDLGRNIGLALAEHVF